MTNTSAGATREEGALDPHTEGAAKRAIAPSVICREMRAVWQAATTQQLPVAFWRQPRTHNASAIVSLTPPSVQSPDFLSRTPGFYLAPFRESGAPLFLPADIRIAFPESGMTLGYDTPARVDPAVVEQWLAALESARAGVDGKVQPGWYTNDDANAPAPIRQHAYEELVRDAIDFIQQHGIAKVVVSRAVTASLPHDFDPVTLFDTLCQRYAHAFVSLVAVPGVGTWIGASPELLLSVDDTSLRTMALAGTQPRPDPAIDPHSVRWGEKEVVEQELVSRYVRNFFHDAGYTHFVEQGPQTVTAGKVFHLQSSFHIDLPEAERLALANQVLSELHPTSAVCGMPRREALSFIVEHEGYDRSFYSGFLGPVFLDCRSTLYVNLRCMQLFEDSATLYVGGGITADSDPVAEWMETVVKSQTILDALGGNTANGANPSSADASVTQPRSARPRDERRRATTPSGQLHAPTQAHTLMPR